MHGGLDKLPTTLWSSHLVWRSDVHPHALLLQGGLACQKDGTDHRRKQDERSNFKWQHKVRKEKLANGPWRAKRLVEGTSGKHQRPECLRCGDNQPQTSKASNGNGQAGLAIPLPQSYDP